VLFIDTACFAIHEACSTKWSVLPRQHNTAGLKKFAYMQTMAEWTFRILAVLQISQGAKACHLRAGMPGTAVLLQSSDKDLKSCTWTYREKKVKLSATCLLAGYFVYSI
jgi:hypothetical protein